MGEKQLEKLKAMFGEEAWVTNAFVALSNIPDRSSWMVVVAIVAALIEKVEASHDH